MAGFLKFLHSEACDVNITIIANYSYLVKNSINASEKSYVTYFVIFTILFTFLGLQNKDKNIKMRKKCRISEKYLIVKLPSTLKPSAMLIRVVAVSNGQIWLYIYKHPQASAFISGIFFNKMVPFVENKILIGCILVGTQLASGRSYRLYLSRKTFLMKA